MRAAAVNLTCQEADTVDMHLLKSISGEKIVDVMRSTLVFLLIVIVLGTLGVVFFAAH